MRLPRQLALGASILALTAHLAAVDIPAPAAIPEETAFAVLVVPDLAATLGHAEAAAGAMGMQVPPGMLAAAVGAQLGAADAAWLGKGPAFAIASQGMMIPTWAVVIPVANPEALATALKAKNLNARALGTDKLLIADLAGGEAVAERVAPKIADVAKGMAPGADLRLLVAWDRIFTTYGPLLEAQLGGMAPPAPQPGQPDPQAGLRMVGGVLPMIAALADATQAHQVDLTIGSTGVTIDAIVAAKPASPLAKGLAAPAGPLPSADLLGKGPAAGTTVGRFNPAIFATLADILAATAKTNPKVKALASDELLALLREVPVDGALALRQGTGDHPSSMEVCYGVTDAARTTAWIAKAAKLTQSGPVAELLAASGMGQQFTENARKGPKGEAISLVKTVAAPNADPMIADIVAKQPAVEFAIVGKQALLSTTPADLDAMLAGTKRGGAMPAAVGSLGAGWDLYSDIDVARALQLQAKVMEGNPAGMMLAMIAGNLKPGLPPVASAMAAANGRLRAQVAVPLDLIAGFVAMGQAMGQGGGDQGQPKPRKERKNKNKKKDQPVEETPAPGQF
jgi:hypothetical protein